MISFKERISAFINSVDKDASMTWQALNERGLSSISEVPTRSQNKFMRELSERKAGES